MNTSCKNCIFSQWEEKTQIGCQLGKLDKYPQRGVVLVEVHDDDGLSSCLLKDKLCLHKRTKDWTKYDSNEEMRLQVAKAYDETRFCYQSIIDLEAGYDVVRLISCLSSIKAQKIQPEKITVIKKAGVTIPNGVIAKSLNGKFKRWRVQEEADLGECQLDIAVNSDRYPFYIYSHIDSPYPESLTYKLDCLINFDLWDFGILSLDSKIDVVSTAVHLNYQGNAFATPLRQKIIDDGFESKLLKWKDLNV